MPIENISLSQLDLSPLNVRKTRTKEHIASMAASIEVQGILQNLRVHPTGGGKFGVVIGGTRLEGLRLLLKQKKIEADYPVPCDVRPADDPTLTEASLSENVVREAMHPADEFDAFKKLADEGKGAETIAARFGTTPIIVQRRLKLAAVSPKLMKAFRADEMTLDQLMAFTLTDDHKAQEKVWKELPEWAKERGSDREIREALTKQQAAADSKLAKFVGLDVYKAAGGHINIDLFDADGAGWLTNTDLLNRIVGEKLAEAAEGVKAEGWKWVRHAPEFPYEVTQKDGRLYPKHADPEPDTQAKIDAIQAEADQIMEEHGEEPADEEISDRLIDLQHQIDELSEGEQVWTAEQKAASGVYVTIGHDGSLVIKRGVLKPEDKSAAKKLNGAGQGGDADESEEAPAKAKGGLSAALIAELTAQKTVAAQLVMATNPKVALLAVTHALALRQLYPHAFADHSSLGISAHSPTYTLAIRESVDASPAGKKLATIIKGWQKKLPKKPEDLWGWMEKQPPATLQAIIAVCVATTIDMVRANGAEAKPASIELAKAIKLDMSEFWEASADNYFSRVPKKHALAELNGMLKPAQAKDIEGLKRDAAAKTMAGVVKGKKWLPPILRAE